MVLANCRNCAQPRYPTELHDGTCSGCVLNPIEYPRRVARMARAREVRATKRAAQMVTVELLRLHARVILNALECVYLTTPSPAECAVIDDAAQRIRKVLL
jgi:hypothetical protein